MYKKKLKRMAVIICIIILIFNVKFVIDSIVRFNLDVSFGNFVGLYALFLIEISIILIFYDFLMLESYVIICSSIETLCRLSITRQNVWLAMFLIRVNYNTSRVFKFLRLGWIRYGDPNLSPVWRGISNSNLFQKVSVIFRVVISIPAMLAIVFTLFTLNIINLDLLHNQWEYYFEYFKKAFTIRINFGNIFSKLPAVVALITLIPALFFLYFYSQKREVRKIIDKKNKESFEIVVIKHNELSKLISRSIYTICENLDYVIDCQSLIVNLILDKKIKNSYELEGRYYHAGQNIETYLFLEIPEIQNISELIAELTSEELDCFTRLFSVKRYDIWHFYWMFSRFKTSEKVNRLFLTKQGIKEMLSKVRELSFAISKEELDKYRDEQQNILSYSIYDSLETLYALKRYNESLKRYITSSKTEKTLMKTLDKEK